jgi:iron complex outermembrane recepter protein
MEFDVAENNMFYATYKTGYKNGGLNIQGTVPPTPFDPEKVKAYTIGSKNRFMNNRLQLNDEAYYYDYTGYQVFVRLDVYDPLTDSMIGAMNVINADKGTNAGIDISSDYMITANDRFSVSLAYMKTKFWELTTPANSLAGIDAYDMTGTDLPQSPHWSGTHMIRACIYP